MLKKLILPLLLLAVSGCAEKPLDIPRARAVAEELITRTYEGKYDGIESLYTAAFNESEPVEFKKDKLNRLRFTLGPVKKLELLSSTQVSEFGEQQQVKLNYRVEHTRATTIEIITVMEDEGGYKVSACQVETEH